MEDCRSFRQRVELALDGLAANQWCLRKAFAVRANLRANLRGRPNGLEIEKETTLMEVRWTRVVLMK